MSTKNPEVDHVWFDQSSSFISLQLSRLSLPLYSYTCSIQNPCGNNRAAAECGMGFQAKPPPPKENIFFLEATNKCLL